MKKYLVRFNRPLLIGPDTYPNRFINIYGFLAKYGDNELQIRCDIGSYVNYLCALADYTSGSGEFIISGDYWIAKDGVRHRDGDSWSQNLGAKCRKKLNLIYTVQLIDLDEVADENNIFYQNGVVKSVIINQECIDYLTDVAESQKKDRHKYHAMLFNRPIWLRKEIIWPGEKGFCSIYGSLAPINDYLASTRDVGEYLGYLSAIEECLLNDETPSGYVSDISDSYSTWYDEDGKAHNCRSDEMTEEYYLCQKKNNLRYEDVFICAPDSEIEKYIKDGFLLSQDYYEELMNVVETADDDE